MSDSAGVGREEHLYLLSPEALPERRVMVTVRLPGDRPEVVLAELDRFFELLQQLYQALGGAGLTVSKLREALLGTPTLALQTPERHDVPLEQFVEVFTKWVAEEKTA